MIGIFVVVGLAVGVVGGMARPQPEAVVRLTTGAQENDPDRLVPVHVSGSVVSPGVVWVAEGSLVSAAIEAAGGALVGADLDAINLAGTVFEGDQINVGVEGVESSGGPPGPGGGLIDINRASPTELEALPGVGPVLAANIVAHRESIGRFESIEDLLDVPGIGETRLASIRDLIRPP